MHKIGSPRDGKGYGGITWADKSELETAMLPGYHQVVGHTKVASVQLVQADIDTSVTFIDVLNTVTFFHEVNIPNVYLGSNSNQPIDKEKSGSTSFDLSSQII